MSSSGFHDNLQEVSTTIADLENHLRAIQQAANVVGTAIPVEFRACYDQFNEIVTAIRQEVVHRAFNTAKFTYNNILSQVIRDDVSGEEKLLKLRRFREAAPTNMRAGNIAAATQTWQRLRTLKSLVEGCEVVLGQYGFNITAILNRFDTVLNGIGWFSGIFYQRIEEYARSWEEKVLSNTLTKEGLEDNIVWLVAVISQMERF